MKEININIEGYNVNGICVGCLNFNRRMFYDADIKKCFKLLADIDVSDGLDIQVCWECLAYVKKCMMFRSMVLNSYEYLISYSKENTFLNSPKDFEAHAVIRLTNTRFYISENCNTTEDSLNSEVKAEDVENILDIDSQTTLNPDIPIKEEPDMIDIPIKEEPDMIDDVYDDLPSPLNDVISDDDIQLSLLKDKGKDKKKKKKKKLTVNNLLNGEHEEKTDRIKKRKSKKDKKQIEDSPNSETQLDIKVRKNNKLKNLPNIVELYTMTEEEMWSVRDGDRQSEEFTKLKFTCKDCVLSFNTDRLRSDHINGKHKKKPHQCPVCQAYFINAENLTNHRSLHLNAYRCVMCAFKSTLKMRMLKHVASHDHVQSYICDSCGAGYNSKSKLTYHRKICSRERPQCDCCGKVFANKMTLKYHFKSPDNKSDKPKDKLFIPCKGCDKIFHSKKSYRAHVVIHDGITYPCPICGKLFQWKRNLARHTRNHRERESGALHECRLCRKSFSSRDCYNNHIRLSKKHVPEESYQHQCNYCLKKFATKWCLTDHVDWDHLKRIKYQCSICFKAFKTAKIMVAHVNNIHGGKKKTDESDGEHLCDICGKSYKTVKRLKGHVWAMHTNRSKCKSFKCKLCPAAFTWQTSIYKHMKMMHDNNKKNKPPRTVPSVKKEEPYLGIELGNVPYVQQDLANNINLVTLQQQNVNQNRLFYSMIHK